jgi:hypothetical protein
MKDEAMVSDLTRPQTRPVPPNRTRSRKLQIIAVIATIALGLASRRYPFLFPSFLGKYPGDALWSLMVFLGLGAVFLEAPGVKLAMAALCISYGVEFLKLYQAPWLISTRQTTLGHLILGHAFSWPNLVAYPVGIGVGLLVELRASLVRTNPISSSRSERADRT